MILSSYHFLQNQSPLLGKGEGPGMGLGEMSNRPHLTPGIRDKFRGTHRIRSKGDFYQKPGKVKPLLNKIRGKGIDTRVEGKADDRWTNDDKIILLFYESYIFASVLTLSYDI